MRRDLLRWGSLACLLSACASVQSSYDTSLSPPASITLTWLAPNRIEVNYRVAASAMRSSAGAQLKFRTKHLGDEYTQQFVKQLGPGGTELPWSGHLQTEGAYLTCRYRVDLSWKPPSGVTMLRGPRSWGDSQSLVGFVFLADLFAHDEAVAVAGELVFPDTLAVVSSLSARGPRFEVNTTIELGDALYVRGTFAEQRHLLDGLELQIVSGTYTREELQPSIDLLQRSFRVANAMLGSPKAKRLLVVIEKHADEAGEKFAYGGQVGFITVGPQRPMQWATAPSSIVLIHELMHVWWPADVLIKEAWIKEGLTDYLTLAVASRVDGLRPETRVRVLQNVHAEYSAMAQGLRIGDTASNQIYGYHAGALVGFCLETHLGDGVAHALHEAAQRYKDPKWLDSGGIVRMVRRQSRSTAELLEDWLEHRGALDLDACLKQSGFDAQTVTYNGMHPRFLMVDVLGTPGVNMPSKSLGMQVLKVTEKSEFQVGDLIWSLNGEPISHYRDIDYLMRSAQAGDAQTFVVLRQGATTTVTLTTPRVPEEQRMQHEMAVIAH